MNSLFTQIAFITILFLSRLNSQNTYWVSNKNDGVEVDFTDLSSAYNAASPGDTLILYPSPYGYGDLYAYKEIHIKGIGYLIDTISQPSLQIKTFQVSASLGSLGFDVGSGGSSVESVKINYFGINGNADNCQIRKSEIISACGLQNSNNNCISGCYIHPGLLLNLSSSNIIRNNIILGGISGNAINNVFENNILIYVQVYYSLLYNNIIINGLINSEVNSINHNVFFEGAPGEDGNGNIYGANNVFIGYPNQGNYSFDSRWQLAPESPAIGAGVDGADCGMFGGQYPYKLSGILNRPLIYEMNAPIICAYGEQFTCDH